MEVYSQWALQTMTSSGRISPTESKNMCIASACSHLTELLWRISCQTAINNVLLFLEHHAPVLYISLSIFASSAPQFEKLWYNRLRETWLTKLDIYRKEKHVVAETDIRQTFLEAFTCLNKTSEMISVAAVLSDESKESQSSKFWL